MSALGLRQLAPLQAQASRALGVGLSATFQARGLSGELRVTPLPAETQAAPGTWFDSALGALHLSDAGALLSMLGELPVSVAGDSQAWYWQVISQQLSPLISTCLAPLSMRESAPSGDLQMRCALRVTLGEEVAHGQLTAAAGTLLQLLQAPFWHPLHRPFPAALQVHEPLILGRCELTLEQLASLRPGDVVVPSDPHFDCDGQGVLALAGQRWRAQTTACGTRLLLNLEIDGHEHDDH